MGLMTLKAFITCHNVIMFIHLIDCIFMDQAGSGDGFLELGHKWCMGIVHDVTSQYDI